MARRKNETRKMREPLPTVIGAGITEKWYFRHLKDFLHLRIDVKPKYFGSDTAHDMQKLVDNVLAMGGKAVCVFDMDTTRWDEMEKERKNRFIEEYRKNPDVILCESMPSIEYWFLLHFEKTNRYFGSSDKVIDALREYMPFEKSEKFLSQSQWIATMISDNKDGQAMKNAKELGESGESYTKIHKALQLLNKNKNEKHGR
ncbi:MAG: RloB domain-containing protein [Paludibacteraceae bacterium]|nr:RloB domain-containing protein [Paludibacteraceae bacterium]